MEYKIGDRIRFKKPKEMRYNSDEKQEQLSGFKGKIIGKGKSDKDILTVKIFNFKYMGEEVIFVHKDRFKKVKSIKLNDNLFLL